METSTIAGGADEFHLPDPSWMIMTHQYNLITNQQNLGDDYPLFITPSSSRNSLLSTPFSPSATLQVEKQAYDDIDRFLNLQNERLRAVLQEERRKRVGMILKRVESTTRSMIRQKEEEIAMAIRRRAELQGYLKEVEMENEAWQRAAREREAVVLSLNNTLQQVRDKYRCVSSSSATAAEDAESCCCGGEEEEDEGKVWRMTACKSCNWRRSCILFLPCRHMCSCKVCDAFLHFCPVCLSSKKATIQVLMF